MLFYLNGEQPPRCLSRDRFLRLHADMRQTLPKWQLMTIDGPLGPERVLRHLGTGITFRGRIMVLCVVAPYPKP